MLKGNFLCGLVALHLMVFNVAIASDCKTQTQLDISEFYHNCQQPLSCYTSNGFPTSNKFTPIASVEISYSLVILRCTPTSCPGDEVAVIHPPTPQTLREIICEGFTLDDVESLTPPDVQKPSLLKEYGSEVCGSIVGVENQTLGESISLPGLSFKLNYFTNLSDARKGDFTISTKLTGAEPSVLASSYEVKTYITGIGGTNPQTIDFATLNSAPNLTHEFLWQRDGGLSSKWGMQEFHTDVTPISPLGFRFATWTYRNKLGSFNARELGLGGWLPSIYRYYDYKNGFMFGGDGSLRKVYAQTKSPANLYGDYYWIPEEDGSVVYYFNMYGLHTSTKSGITGANLFKFNYVDFRLYTIEEPFGLTTRFIRDQNDKLALIIAPRGAYIAPVWLPDLGKPTTESGTLVTKVTINESGLISSLRALDGENGGAGNPSYEMTYNADGLLVTFKKPGGQLSTFTYDNYGNLTRDAHSSGYFFDLVKTLGLNGELEVKKVTPSGSFSSYSMVPFSNTISTNAVSDAEGKTSETIVTMISNAPHKKASIKYNFGNVSKTVMFQDHPRFMGFQFPSSDLFEFGIVNLSLNRTISSTITNNDIHAVTQEVYTETVNGQPFTTTTYDGSTKIFTKVDSRGVVTKTQIDELERIVSLKVGSLAPVLYVYNNDMLVSVSQDTKKVSFEYDALGRIDKVKNNLNNVLVDYAYDLFGRISSETFADGSSLLYTYDANGNRTSVSKNATRFHAFEFNLSDFLKSYETPEVSINGNWETNLTSFTYDVDQNLKRINKPSGKFIELTYNHLTGDLNKMTTSEGDYLFSINSQNRMIAAVVTPKNFQTEFGYTGAIVSSIQYKDSNNNNIGSYNAILDPNTGLVISDTVTVGNVQSMITYSYGSDLRMQSAGDITINYDTNGYVQGTILNNIMDGYLRNSKGDVDRIDAFYAMNNFYYEKLIYNNVNKIAGLQYYLDNRIQTYNFSYGPSGKLVNASHSGFGSGISVTSDSYEYESPSNVGIIGNRLKANIGARTTFPGYSTQINYQYSYDDTLSYYNSMPSSSLGGFPKKVEFEYTRDGERSLKKVVTYNGLTVLSTETTSYFYDEFGNLTKVILPNSNIVEYEIDGLNRRVGKKINGQVVKRWIWQDELRIAGEVDSSGNLVKRFVYATKDNIPDYMIMGGVNYKIITNRQGSLRAVVNSQTGAYLQILDHDEFGRVLRDTNPGVTPFGFAGGIYDNDTFLVKFGVRDYDPDIGQWTSKDPLLFAGGSFELYSYTDNDPVNWIDIGGTSKSAQIKVNDAFQGGGGGRPIGGGFNTNQRALIDLAKRAQHTGLTKEQGEIMRTWSKELNIPFRGPEVHPGRTFGQEPHFHIGPINHIKCINCCSK
ncbi:RHS repeat domain-containing protein [Bdellovibrio bacteriovorus]|uniref:RHS repeat domain-containing protein n=1 Tax=Bdellovibrio bacteriovorus TaxID=959 RepID=UPI0035A5AA95